MLSRPGEGPKPPSGKVPREVRQISPERSQVPCAHEVTWIFANLCLGSKNTGKTAESQVWRVSVTPALTVGESRLASRSYKSAVKGTLAAEASRLEMRSLSDASHRCHACAAF
jgi:hypothetical protein